MKTNKLTILIVCLLITFIGHTQKTYLKITKSNEINNYEMYPPGTKFELKNKHGYIVFKNSDEPGKIDIDDTYILYVYPNWKKEADIFRLTEGFLEKIPTNDYSMSATKSQSIKSNGATAEYVVRHSNNLEGQKNLEFKLSNGITFEYFDGNYRAYFKEKENYLHIEGKYLIESDLGTLKLSYNSNSGVVWWVFEPIKNGKH